MLKLTDAEKHEMNVTIHTPGWAVIQRVYEDRVQMAVNDLISTAPLNANVDYSRGSAAAYREAQVLPYNIVMKDTKREDK